MATASKTRRIPMTKLFSTFAAALMLSLGVAAFQPVHAAVSNYGQSTETGAYAPGGTSQWPRGGN